MDFHKSFIGTAVAVIFIALTGLGTAMLIGGLTGDTGVRIHFIFFLAPVALVASVIMLINTLRPMKMRIDERGILIDHKAKKVKVALAWQYVASVSVAELPKPKDEKGKATYLTVWPQGGYNPGVPQEWAIQQNGWTGYRLLDVDDIRESKDQLTQALTHYAAPIFR